MPEGQLDAVMLMLSSSMCVQYEIIINVPQTIGRDQILHANFTW